MMNTYLYLGVQVDLEMGESEHGSNDTPDENIDAFAVCHALWCLQIA